MKLKRILSLALSGVLEVSLMTGCFGGGGKGGNEVKYVDGFVSALNGATNNSPEVESSDTLSRAVRRVTTEMTIDQAKEGLADEALREKVRDITDTVVKPQLDEPSAWDTYKEAKKFSTVRIYAAGENVNAATIANKVKSDVFDKIQLSNAVKGDDYTNSYKCYASAYEVTVSDGADAEDKKAEDVTVYVVGIQIDRSVTINPASND